MLDALESIYDLGFHSPTPPPLRTIFKSLNCSKQKLFIYKISLGTNLFHKEMFDHLAQLMAEQVQGDTNLNPYALYVVWGRNLFSFNLCKKGVLLALSAPSHIYLEPWKRPEFLTFTHQLNFETLIEFPPEMRDKFSLSHANEALNYNDAIKKLIPKLKTIESYLVKNYIYEPYFLHKSIQDFLFGLSQTTMSRLSPKRGSRAPSPFVDVPTQGISQAEFDIHPDLMRMCNLKENELFQQVQPISPHIHFEHFILVEEEALKIHGFIRAKGVFGHLMAHYTEESRQYFSPPKTVVSHARHANCASPSSGMFPFPEIARLFEPTGLRVITESLDDEIQISENQESFIRILKKLELKELFRVIQTYDYDESEELFRLCGLFIPERISLFKGLVCQNQLNLLLKKFGVDNEFTPETDRLILTSHDVRAGLDMIATLAQKHIISEEDIEEEITDSVIPLESLRGMDIRTLAHTTEGLGNAEIAWGILDVLLRKENRPFISCSKELIKFHASQLQKDTTLVLDGHGGTSDVKIGDGAYSVDKMKHLTLDFLREDTDGHIKHIILQSCVSARLKLLKIPYYLKNKPKESGKQRMLIVDTPMIQEEKNSTITVSRDYFVKTSSICLAQSIINAIFLANKQLLIAFTFSPNLINPSFILGLGNVGIVPETPADGQSYAEWGKDVAPERFDNKSISIFWNPEHPKLQKNQTKYQHFTPSTSTP
ncbi:MAG TPA: hypothetical protein DCZ80_04660 [Legionellales bacterium]|nr:hypothetical protein [Legionellales bacterium]